MMWQQKHKNHYKTNPKIKNKLHKFIEVYIRNDLEAKSFKHKNKTLQHILKNVKQASNHYVCNVWWNSGEISENHEKTKQNKQKQHFSQPSHPIWLVDWSAG